MNELPAWIRAARDQWQWQGQARPDFAAPTGPEQISVWDFPRPPRLVSDTREVIIRWGDIEVARSRRAVLVLETSHPPSFYLPWGDITKGLLKPAGGGSFCEWKGPAKYWHLVQENLKHSKCSLELSRASTWSRSPGRLRFLLSRFTGLPSRRRCSVAAAGNVLWWMDYARACGSLQGGTR